MTIAREAGLIALAVTLTAAALFMPPTVASADDAVDDAVFTLVGTAHLSGGIDPTNDDVGCLGGIAAGAGTSVGAPGLGVAAGSRTGAVFTYNATFARGDALGELWIEALHIPSFGTVDVTANFEWLRIGATALVTLSGNESGVAVAVFLPVDFPLFDCTGKRKDGGDIAHGNWANELHAQVVGVGVITTLLG